MGDFVTHFNLFLDPVSTTLNNINHPSYFLTVILLQFLPQLVDEIGSIVGISGIVLIETICK